MHARNKQKMGFSSMPLNSADLILYPSRDTNRLTQFRFRGDDGFQRLRRVAVTSDPADDHEERKSLHRKD